MLHILRFVSSHPLTCNHKLKAALRVLHWQLRSRINSEIWIPWIGATGFMARRGMTGITGNIYVGLHEFPDMCFLLHFLRSTDLFIDIGANVGSYSLLASGVCKAHSVSFEPAPETSVYLRKNVLANGLEDIIEVHEAVVGATKDEVPFTVGLDSVNQVGGFADRTTRMVPQVRLDDALCGRNPTMMKIDVEGYEEEVLKGAEETLANESLVAIELETLSEFSRCVLSRHGFVRVYYDPYQRLLSEEPVRFRASNALYVRNVAFVRERVLKANTIRVLDSLV